MGARHESPALMTVPLWILAALSIASGWALQRNGLFASLVHFARESEHAHHAPGWLGAAAFGVFLVGFLLSYTLYGSGDLGAASRLRGSLSPLADILERRYGFDAFFLALVALSDRLAAALFWIDANIIDAIFVDGWGLVTRALSEIGNFFDTVFVDGAVDGVGAVTECAGAALRKLACGEVQAYLLYIAVSVGLFAVTMQHLLR